MSEQLLRGLGVSPGSGVAPAYVLVRSVPEPSEEHAEDPAAELTAASEALEAVAVELERRGDSAGGDAADVLAAQAMMARDPSIIEMVQSTVHTGATAARAVYEAFGSYREVLAGAGDYLAGRVSDLDDIRDRAVARLLGVPVPGLPATAEPYVLVARDLAPADTAGLDPDVVQGLVTEEGGPTSHTAILARSLGLPAVVACPGAAQISSGDRVHVDGTSGEVVRAPSNQRVERAAATDAARSAAAASTGPGRTKDGRAVPLLANIGGPKDVRAATAAGAEGVGLFRTEFLFLDSDTEPGEQEQVAAYREVLQAFPDGHVVVRVLDAGADKPLAFLPAPEPEENPALGVRGARMLARHPDLLDRQLSALATAAADGGARLEVMAPMVADAAEAQWFAERCAVAGIDQVGVMIEVPAAALRSGDIAEHVQFVSLGTNDLTQYTFAADRMAGALAAMQDAWQPALLDLVALTADAVGAAGGRTGVCGEAAADPALACVLVGLGVQTLSMSAPALGLVRAALAAHSVTDCEAAADAARGERSAAAARAAAREHLPGLDALGL